MISVVIPAWNEEKYIATCIEHLLNQTVKADEIIIVDNNSTDRTVEIAQNYPVTIVHEKIQGITPARNLGLNTARGEYILRTDADTRAPHTWIESMMESFKKHPDAVAVTGPLTFYDLPGAKKESYKATIKYSKISRKLYGHEVLTGPNMGIKKDAWEKIKNSVCLDDRYMHEDIDISIHLSRVGKIYFDYDIKTAISARRIKYNPGSFFIGYAFKHIPMILRHKIQKR